MCVMGICSVRPDAPAGPYEEVIFSGSAFAEMQGVCASHTHGLFKVPSARLNLPSLPRFWGISKRLCSYSLDLFSRTLFLTVNLLVLVSSATWLRSSQVATCPVPFCSRALPSVGFPLPL